MARWKAHGLLERLSLLRFRSYEARCAQLGCFRTEVDLFALKYTALAKLALRVRCKNSKINRYLHKRRGKPTGGFLACSV